MIEIKELVKKCGSQQKLAGAMGVKQNQVARWCKCGALVSPLTGEVYIPTRKVNVLTGE